MNDTLFSSAEAFARNIGLLTPEEQEKLRQATVVIVGLGGVGGIEALGLARLGVGGFHLIDPDTFETANFNRQFGASVPTVGKNKAETMANMIRDINPEARIKVWAAALTEENVGEILHGASVVVDGIDFFAQKTRRLFFNTAREQGLFVVTAGPIGFGSALITFDPRGMGYDEYFAVDETMDEEALALRFGLGLTPTLLQRRYFSPKRVNFRDGEAPSVAVGVLLAAGLALTDTVKILLGKPVAAAPRSLHFDPWLQKLRRPFLPWGNRGPLQRLKIALVSRLARR